LSYTESLDALIAHRVERSARRDIDRAGHDLDRLTARRTRLRMGGSAVVAAAPLATTIATLAVIGPSAASIAGPVLGVLVLWPLATLELVGTVNDTASTAPNVAGSAHRVISVLDTPDALPSPSDPRPVGDAPDLTVDELTARWPAATHDALGPVSIDLPSGSHTTITGPSGSGKSTFASVLVGFLPPHAGSYRIDGDDVDTIGGANVRERVTWVQQLPWLADTTVRENLRIADPSASEEALRAALEAVRLDAWLGHLPHGLDSRIGRGGSGMSGGEVQRLALARVLLADHRVVVLDEPTANLDANTAERVLATLRERFADRTTIVLGHDTVARASPS
jgi:ABC-type transport system involved in cytochrome bd biosynthesis fused ATPase/permease subunit